LIDISIVIVNYNVKDLVDNCISSVYASNDNKYNIEIFFVDNNSIDGSVNLIEKKYPDVRIIRNEKNLGFSKANNIALKQISGKYVLILNPDTFLEENTFDKLISFCKSDSKVGAVTSKLILSNGKLDSACRRSFPTFSVAFPRMLGLSKIFPKSKLFGKYNLTYLDENETYEIDSICGAFMFIPKNVIDAVGFFDEEYFMYGEDIDLCYRIKKSGYKIFYYPEVTTIHYKGSSTRKTKISYVNNFYGAMSIFVKKNLKGATGLVSFILRFGIFSRSLVSYSKRIVKFMLHPMIDAAFIYSSLILSVYLRFNIFPNPSYLFIMGIYVIVWIILLSMFGLYSKKHKLSIVQTLNGIVSGFFINSSITYFFKQYAYSREVILSSTIISLFILIFWRSVVKFYKFFVSKNISLNKINMLIVGDKKLTQGIEDKLEARYNIFYFNELSIRKTLEELKEVIQLNGINEVIFSQNQFTYQEILNVMWHFRKSNISFKLVPTEDDLILSKLHSKVDELTLIEIEYNINNKINIFIKQIFDILVSLILLVSIYPFVLIKLKIFKKELSKHTKKILLLPYVLSGRYSLVGIPVWYENQNKEFLGKIGLTGLIQIYHNSGMSKEEMDNYNLFYAKNQNLVLDFEILLKTIFLYFKK